MAVFLISCQAPPSNSGSKGFDSIAPLEIEYAVAVRFINDYVGFLSERNREMGFIEWVDQRTDVSKDFKFELNRIMSEAANEPPGLGFDPILDSQDFPERVEVHREDGSYVTVKGIDWPQFRLTLKLTYETGSWLVDGSGVVNVPKEKRVDR